MNTAELRALDRRYLWHPFTPMTAWLEGDPLVIVAGDGFELIDSDGNRYLDGVSSLWCNVHGHRVPEIDAAIRAQLEKIAHSTMLGLANEPAAILAEKLVRIAPAGLTKVFYSDAGATATEIAFKLAAQYWFNRGKPAKHEFVAFTEAYHGDTVGAMSVGRMPAFHRPYLPLLFKVHFAPIPGEGSGFGVQGSANTNAVENHASSSSSSSLNPEPRTLNPLHQSLAALREILERHHEQLAAVCIEPVVQGAGGIIVQPPGFLAEVRRLCDQFDVLLICDEVATGFGRTGKMFAVEHEGVRPDLMTVAKGLTGGYLPLAATLATQRIFDAFLGRPEEGRTFYHGHTYTGNPLACAAAIANLDRMSSRDTVGNVARNAPKLAEMLAPLRELKHVADVRQKGYMVGIELVKDQDTREAFDPKLRVGHAVCQRIRERGVIVRPLGDVVVLMPAPAMGEADLARLVQAVAGEIAAL
jgi:adenosylmethionine-8-amino-7-oxononanoate aminotransferase